MKQMLVAGFASLFIAAMAGAPGKRPFPPHYSNRSMPKNPKPATRCPRGPVKM